MDELWHELVLCGIGGKTIDEAKQSMTLKEFHQWAKYRQKRGTLNLGRRVEQNVGLLNYLFFKVHSKKDKIDVKDFIPHEEETSVKSEPMDFKEFMSMFGAR